MSSSLLADVAMPFDALAVRRRLDALAELVGPPPARQRIAELADGHPDPAGPTVHLSVWRNHAIEPLEPLLHAFARTAGYRLAISTSDYDDSLSYLGLDAGSADDTRTMQLVWFDLTRSALPVAERAPWLAQRLDELADLTGTHIVAVVVDDTGSTVAAARTATGSRVHLFALADLVDDPADDRVDRPASDPAALLDPRLVALAGTQMSRPAQVHAARNMALRLVPALALPPTKLVLVDLDDTLHDGILGERGLEVRVTSAHRRLQQALLTAHQHGTMLAIVSKNDRADVDTLLAGHPDYLIRPHHLVAVEASWRPKAEAIADVLAAVNIDSSAAVFVDDNFAELATVAARFPTLGLIDAASGPAATHRAIDLHPGLFRLGTDAAADVRSTDVRANTTRDALLDGGRRIDAYLAAATPQIVFRVDHAGDAERLADLGLRSNQFNLGLARRDLAAFTTAIDAPDRCVVAADVADRFSDSGTVLGVLVEGTTVVELFLSCRVLGRGLEDAALACALLEAAHRLHLDHLDLAWVRGPRNEPARAWLERLTGQPLEGDRGMVTIGLARLEQAATPATGVEHTMSEQP